LINPQTSGLVQQMFRGADRGRAFGVLGTTVGLGTAIGPLVGGALIALGGPTLGWRLVFFVNIPVGLVVLALSRRLLPPPNETTRHRLDVLGAALLGGATFCVLFACVEYDALRDVRLAWLVVPAAVLLGLFVGRERRLTLEARDPLVDLRLFRRPSYVSGITLALTFFPAMAGLPLVLALFYQRGLGYTALESALGVTAYAVGSAVSAALSGRVVTRIGRKLVVAGAITFGVGAIALAVVALHIPTGHATLALAPPLFVMGCGQGMLITPNQTLALVDVDPLIGSAAGGVLQTGQRIGLAIGQALIGAVFFNSLTDDSVASYSRALGHAVIAAICFVSIAVAIGVHDLLRTRRREAWP
jgi:MFS family permease